MGIKLSTPCSKALNYVPKSLKRRRLGRRYVVTDDVPQFLGQEADLNVGTSAGLISVGTTCPWDMLSI